MAKVSASCRAVGAVGSVGAVGAVQKVDLEVRWICWGHRHGCYLGSCIVSPVSLLRCDVSNSQWNSHDIVTGIGTRTCLTAKPHSILSLHGPCYKLAMEYVDVWTQNLSAATSNGKHQPRFSNKIKIKQDG